jgi:hypoxanthine phosphoribosyltransferase
MLYEAPSWNQIYNMLLNQAQKIRRSNFGPDVIVGVCRGGWVPTRILSDLLENTNLANVKAQNYLEIGKPASAPSLTQPLSAEVRGKTVLVVDEIADTGKSLQLVIDHVQGQGAREIQTATLYYKPESVVKPDFFERQTTCWVVFPWELKETVRQLWTKNHACPLQLAAELDGLAAAGVPKRLITRFRKEFEAKSC